MIGKIVTRRKAEVCREKKKKGMENFVSGSKIKLGMRKSSKQLCHVTHTSMAPT